MKRQDVLALEKLAHLSFNDLSAKDPKLAGKLRERLEQRARRKTIARLQSQSDALRKLAGKINIPLDKTPDKTQLRKAAISALRAAVNKDKKLAGDTDLKQELDQLEQTAAGPITPAARPDVTLAESLRLDMPLAFHPEFHSELEAARIYKFSDAAGFGDKTADLLVQEIGRVSHITEERLNALVKRRKLTKPKARQVGFAASLYQVLDERPEMVAAAKPGIGGMRQLVFKDKAAWEKIIKKSKTHPPGGISADEYAALLVKKFERLFPTDALANRLAQVKVDDVIKAHAGLAELRKLNPGVALIAAGDFDALKTDGLTAAKVKNLRTGYEATLRLVNRYRGMRLAEVLDDGSLTRAKRESEVKRRIDLADGFFADNTDVLAADLTPGSTDINALKFKASTQKSDRAMVLATARAYQRTLTVTDDIETAELLVVGGFPSALSLAMSRPDKLAAETGLKRELAAQYYAKARGIASGVTAHAGTIIDTFKGGFNGWNVGNISPEISGYLKEIPGFEDFFGNQDFCNCRHCQSILSPAAYFVDLMCFVDEHVTQPVFAAHPDHPLNLKTRRPDLWTLELTCDKTNTPIPYLEIINEILENAVATDAGFAGAFEDRSAVGKVVYKDTLPDQVDSFNQPLHLAFEELRTYLRHFDRSLADMAEAGNATGDVLARLRLALPPKDHELITTARTGLPFLRRIYGVQFTETGGKIVKFDAQKLLNPMGVGRSELGELIATRFVSADGALDIHIKGEKRSGDSIQNDIERIEGLTRAALDRMHRFVRLWRATGWRIGELDIVLDHMKRSGLSTVLDAPMVRAVARVHRLQSLHAISVEELVALWSMLPDQPVLPAAPVESDVSDADVPPAYPPQRSALANLAMTLFDRLFNQTGFPELDLNAPPDFLHPALSTAPPAAVDPNLHRMQAGTGTGEDQLLQLILGLARPLGIDPASADDNEKKFVLNRRNLTLIFRHARLARLLKVGIPELFALAGLTPEIKHAYVEHLEQLEGLLDTHAWWQTTDWSLEELVQMVRPGLAAIVSTPAPVANTAGGETITYTPNIGGIAQPAETVTFGANPDLPSVVADWNAHAQHSQAYASDAFGAAVAGGNHLSIRSMGTGPHAKIKVTADSASLFTAVTPHVAIGDDITPILPQLAAANTAVQAQELVNQVQASETLLFADTVLALMPSRPPIATSSAVVANTAGGETVTYTPVLNARTEAAVTITFAANASLDAVVDDWNSQAAFTRAYRSDPAGNASAAGNHLSVMIEGASGGDTRLIITADSGPLFAANVPKTYRGAEITEEQSRAIVNANPAVFEIADAEGRYRLGSGFDPATALGLPALISPTATSRAPVNGSAAGDKVKIKVVINDGPPSVEDIVLGANANIAAVVAEWNGLSALTTAYRSDASGAAAATGSYLSIKANGTGGRNTVLTIIDDFATVFTSGGAQYRGVGVWVDPALEPQLREYLLAYHSAKILLSLLPGILETDPGRVARFIEMLNVDLNAGNYFLELRGDVVPPDDITRLIAQLRTLVTLFGTEAVFDAENLEFIRTRPALFGIGSFDSLTIASVQRIELFRRLAEVWLTREEFPPDIRAILVAFDPVAQFADADQRQLAAALDCDLGLLQSLHSRLNLSPTPFEALRELLAGLSFAKHTGTGGGAISLAQSREYDDLATAAAALAAAFRANYEDEAEWEQQFEPFCDELLSRRRDGLVAYLIHSGAPQFDEVTDLYHYFLLDVELEGCARTSRVASAIDSAQLYVQRCLMNLEETPPGDANPVHVMPESIPPDEWDWRKHYRVWEANRKIFLYPENFIEPELRGNKTPLFKSLEEDLLSKEITDEAILEAYERYLSGFDELAHLTIAGSYHEKDKAAKRDVLHLIGVTSDDPPIYYYRRAENAHYGITSDERSTHWGPWEKIDIQIPVRKVAPVVHNGQLYIFWNRHTTKPVNKVSGGSSQFVGYQHRAFVEFSKRRLDGSWTTPQPIHLDESPFSEEIYPDWYREEGIIDDPIESKQDLLIGFICSTEILGVKISFWMDPSGNAIVNILGHSFEVTLPVDSIDTHHPSTITINDMDFDIRPIRIPAMYAPLYDHRVHKEPNDSYTLSGFGWDQLYPSSGSVLSLRGFDFQMWSPVDLYKLKIGARYEYEDPEDTGVPWINPGIIALLILIILLTGSDYDIDQLLETKLVWSRAAGERKLLHSSSACIPCFDSYTFASLLLEEARFKKYTRPLAGPGTQWAAPQWSVEVTDYLSSLLTGSQIANIPGDATLSVVNGSVGDVIVQTSRDAFYLQGKVRGDGKYHLRRLNTSISENIATTLFNRGLEVLLSTENQMALAEQANDLNLVAAKVHDAGMTGEVDFRGAMGVYLREIFFHIPFLIANHLNSEGRYEEAQRWYHFIFDPTSSETIQGLPPGLSDEERRRRELDRNWRYREFRGITLDSFRDQLTDDASIEEYRRHPFNPHAIARLRISAYQKAIVMKYVDNLLDWGDDLFVRAFAQLNPEYLREASLKYVMALEILGDRPVQLGDCGEGKLTPKVFPKIKAAMDEDSEFLMEMESIIARRYRLGNAARAHGELVAIDREYAADITGSLYTESDPPALTLGMTLRRTDSISTLIKTAPEKVQAAASRLTLADAMIAKGKSESKDITLPGVSAGFLEPEIGWIPDWGIAFVKEVSPIFCVPGNERMLAYWDRVADRLHKLRHCLDIAGVPRQLPLFAPPIDPGLLVGGKAAGLSLEDILAAAAGSLPPYRFRYLIDKAKGYAATLQGFGSALLSALEKRDAEALAKLRNTHQKNILKLTTEVRRNELKAAEQSVEIVARRQAAAQYRKEYYEGLIASGLSGWEIAQYASRVTASVIKGVETTFNTAASISFMIPQVGSPFAMKYGGKEIGDSTASWAKVIGVLAGLAELTGTVAGIQAGFDRREQGWVYQKKAAEKDLETIAKELSVAELRRDIARRGLELHEKAKDQHDEVIEFFRDKFSNLGLYTHLSRSLQRLHREAYNNALEMARLAEQAYRFERPGDSGIFVGGEWDASRSGLLAGERLLIGLQNMETRFIETNARQAEINQSFSLAQIAPQALIDLKETGQCDFSLPEFYFDLFYPGQYYRRIRAVRLTIPSITGPYTNISAKLTLRRSYVRRDAALGAARLLEVPLNRTNAVAMSTSQGDAGVFELSFRDERYMPFEGAGAVSEWRLQLPAHFRPFDYQSINDIILNISYTAEEDEILRRQAEELNAAIEGSLTHFLGNNALVRVFSLRQEFSNAFNRLRQSAAGTPVTIDIGEQHFPLFLQGRNLIPVAAHMVLAVADRRSPVGTISISVNGTAATGFPNPTDPPVPGDAFGGLPAKSLSAAFAAGLKKQHTLIVNDAGNFAAVGAGQSFDAEKMRDMMIVIAFRL